MISLDELKFHVMGELSEVIPEKAAKLALVKALHSFCSDTKSWNENIDNSVSKDVCTYDVRGLFDAEVIRVNSVKFREPESAAHWENITPTHLFFRRVNNDIVFHDMPFDGYEMRVNVTLVPVFGSQNVPTDFLERNAQAIADKAVSTFAAQKGKPWYDPELAARFELKYNSAVSSALARNKQNSYFY